MAPTTAEAPSTIEELPPVCNVADVARYLDCSEFTVRELIKRGDLPHVRLGRLIRITRHELARFLGEG